VGTAVRIACDVAHVLHAAHSRVDPETGRPFVHGSVSPESIVVGYDGSVTLLAANATARAEALRSSPGYLAPEQVSASEVDPRADVFALGVVLWELLASARLFERESASATRIAVVDDPIASVSDLNPAVPDGIAQVLAAALERSPEARFDTVDAFGKALAGAQASSGIATRSKADLARWVAERVPPQASAPAAVPDLVIPGARARAPAESAPALRAPDLSAAPAKAPVSHAVGGGGRELSFDDDLDDMEIERNVASAPLQAESSHASQPRGASTSGTSSPRSAGLELAQPSRMSREGTARERDEDAGSGIGPVLVGALVALAVAGGTFYALLRRLHHAGGYDVTRALPHAFDGSSAPESGTVAGIALVLAVALGFIGLRLKPASWGLLASGGALLLLALAMVTVTLASTGENPTPPDGVLLVPYLFPAAVVLVALGASGRAARLFARGYGPRRLLAIPVATLAGALAFVAFEASRFAR
jgi:hypothetical protein